MAQKTMQQLVRSHSQRKFGARVGMLLQNSRQTCTYAGRRVLTIQMSKFKKQAQSTYWLLWNITNINC